MFVSTSCVALLQLRVTDSPYCAKETRFVKMVCLPDQIFPAGKQCVISGWGATETSNYVFYYPFLTLTLEITYTYNTANIDR